MPTLALQDWAPEDALIGLEGGSSGSSTFTTEVDLRDLGAPDDDGDATEAWVAALAIAEPHVVRIPPYRYTITAQGIVTSSGVSVRGSGRRCSVLDFVPSIGDQACLYFKGGVGTPLYQNSFSDFSVKSSETTLRKFAIRADVCSDLVGERIFVGPDGNFSGGASIAPFTGKSSSALYLNGWETSRFTNMTLASDIPIRVGLNPNDANISIDATLFRGLVMHADGTAGNNNPNFWIETGVQLTRTKIVDCIGIFGGYGIYWNDTTAVATSNILTIDAFAWEQFTAQGYGIYISKNTGAALRVLHIVDSQGGNLTDSNGIFLRNISRATLDCYEYSGTVRALDVDSTVVELSYKDCAWQSGSNVSIGTLNRMEESGFRFSSAPLPSSGRLEATSTNLTGGKVRRHRGVFDDSATGTVANGAQASLDTFVGGITQAMIGITFSGATKSGGFFAYYDDTGAKMITPATADYDVGNVGGKITVFWQSASAVSILNQLGETVTYTVKVWII